MNKVAQYLQQHVNGEIITHGENGFLASGDKEWREALEVLLSNPQKTEELGRKGRDTVESKYSLEHWGVRWLSTLFGKS